MTLTEAKAKLAELAVEPGPLPDYFLEDLTRVRASGEVVKYHSDNGRAFPHDILFTWNFDDGYQVWAENPVSQISI